MTCNKCGQELSAIGGVITKEGLCTWCDYILNSKHISNEQHSRLIERALEEKK
jgi:hypothetical protein